MRTILVKDSVNTPTLGDLTFNPSNMDAIFLSKIQEFWHGLPDPLQDRYR